MNKLDVHSRGSYPSNMLSNFYPHTFYMDGYEISSMEGFLQAITHSDTRMQQHIITHSGYTAKTMGNPKWKERGYLFWNGKSYDRFSDEYQELLDRAYSCLFNNAEFKKALLSTGDSLIVHSIGGHDMMYTILTEYEFCSRLMLLRIAG